jgi:hypothetical protein
LRVTRAGKLAIACWALLAVLAVPVYPHHQSPNELARWATAAALVERHTFEVSSVLPLLNPWFEDLSTVGGRVYSNKAPGGALVALPGYLAARPFTGPPSASAIRFGIYAMRLFGISLPTLLLALAFARVLTRLGAEPPRAGVAVFALLFATPLLAYGLLLFAHALVAACLFGAWALLFAPPDAERPAHALAAGALLGLAVLSEYPAAVPALVLVAVSALGSRFRRAFFAVLGGVPFAAFLLVYDTLCFGGPFQLSSGHERAAQFQDLAKDPTFGIGLPSPAGLAGLLLGPSKGLLLFSPVLLLALPGFAEARRRLSREAFLALVLVPISILLLYAGYRNWHGGWTVGPRYLVSALPFLVLPLAFGHGGRLEATLLGASTAAVALTTLTFPFAGIQLVAPWSSLGVPLLLDGLVLPNLLHLVARPLAIAVPFALVALALVLAVSPRRAPAAAAGAILTVALGLAARRGEGPGARAFRGYVEEVFFERKGALDRELRGFRMPDTLAEQRRRDLVMPPTTWPF